MFNRLLTTTNLAWPISNHSKTTNRISRRVKLKEQVYTDSMGVIVKSGAIHSDLYSDLVYADLGQSITHWIWLWVNIFHFPNFAE